MNNAFTINISMSNAAFESTDSGLEVARMLRELADKIEDSDLHQPVSFTLRDMNGNKCGNASSN